MAALWLNSLAENKLTMPYIVKKREKKTKDKQQYCGFIIIGGISIFVDFMDKGEPQILMFYESNCSIGLYADFGKTTKCDVHKDAMFTESAKIDTHEKEINLQYTKDTCNE